MSYFDNDYLDVPSYEFLQRYPKVYAGTNIHLDGEAAKIISEDGKRYEIVLWVIQSFTEYFANKYPLDEADYYMMNFPEEYEPYLAQMQGAYITVTGDLGDTWFVEGDHIELFGRYIEMSSTQIDGISYTMPHTLAVQRVREVVDALPEEDATLLRALYLQTPPLTLRAYSEKTGIPVMTLHYRKEKLLRLLKQQI